MQDYVVIESLSERHVEQLQQLYENEWWSKGRLLEDVRTAVASSTIVMGFVEPASDRLIAFCRVLSDNVFRATLYDVIVAEGYRGSGLGRRLVQSMLDHPQLQRVGAISLACKPEMIPYYEQFGFTQTPADFVWMRRTGDGSG